MLLFSDFLINMGYGPLGHINFLLNLDAVYTMPVEFENGIKKVPFGLPFARCRQNFVSVSKKTKFVILPFSNSAGIV